MATCTAPYIHICSRELLNNFQSTNQDAAMKAERLDDLTMEAIVAPSPGMRQALQFYEDERAAAGRQ